MAGRVPIVVGILAIAGIVAWFGLRGSGDAPARDGSRPAGSADLTSSPGEAIGGPIAAPAGPALPVADDAAVPRPELPANGEVPSTPPAQVAFDREPRDDAWAAATEREIAIRFRKLRGGKLASTECKTAQCRILITGAQDEVGDTIADLEGPRGMHGFAKHVLLTAPTKLPDGSIELRALLAFER